MEQYTLKDLEILTGIKSDTIRIWEQRYHILKAHRTPTNRRWYSGDDLCKLINISILNRNGVKISEIAAMTEGVLLKKTAELADSKTGSDILTDSLVIAMTRFDEAAVNEILLRALISKGFEETFFSLIFPFLHKIGVLWHIGTVNIGAEHFISNIFRRKLIAAFDNLTPALTPQSRRIIMFLPENEYHELGLLYYAYILRSLGHIVLYLGQSTPVDALIDVSETWKPDILITGTMSGISVKDSEVFVMQLSKAFPGKKVLLTGLLGDVAEKKKITGVFSCRNDKELRMLIK